ncbi:MAG: hypothetical protein PVH68_05840 [Armatimonadota bacterium]|jgi:hypothetical protein
MGLHVLIAMTLIGADPPSADAALAAYLPTAGAPAGVARVEGPTFYHPGNLYKYINGAAEGFIAYDFQRLATATYGYGDGPRDRVVIDLYQMPTQADGFGIYSSERSPGLKFMKLGAEGYIVGNMCIFWKDRHYVKLAARTGTPEAQAILLRLARGLARRLPGRGAFPRLLKAFPPEGLVRRSEKYLAHNMLGHAFMPSGFTADYRLGEERVRLFFAIADDASAARDAHQRLRDFFSEFGEVWPEAVGVGDSAFVGREPFYGRSIIVQQDRLLAGALGAPEDGTGEQLIRDVLQDAARRLKRRR